MSTVSRRSAIAFLAAALLLLKAAMPWLASDAAKARGVDLVEVCTVYGMAMVAVSSDGTPIEAPAAPAENTTGHVGASHCALSGFGAWVPPSVPGLSALPMVRSAGEKPAPASACAPHDVTARWVAWVTHAPPVLS